MRNKIVVILALAVMLTLALAMGFSLLWRLVIISVLALTTGFAWTQLAGRGIEARVKQLPDRCQVGDSVQEEVTFINSSRLPKLFLRTEEKTNIPNHHRAAAFNLGAKGSFIWRRQIKFEHRGQYSLGSYNVIASDPFGFFQRQVTLGKPQSILVCPETIELPHFDPLAYHAYGYGTQGKLAGQMSTNVATVREYTNGDSLKHLHWHTTAHTGKLMVKLFDPDYSRNTARQVWIVLDMQSATNDQITEESTVTIAASLIKKYMDGGSAVGLIAAAGQNHILPPEWGIQPFWNLLTTLALMKAKGDTPVEQVITDEAIRFGGDGIVIVITPSRSEMLASALRQIASREGLAVAILLDVDSVSRSIALSGAQVYTVKRGESIAGALNSRRTRPFWNIPEPQLSGVER